MLAPGHLEVVGSGARFGPRTSQPVPSVDWNAFGMEAGMLRTCQLLRPNHAN